MSKNMNQWLQFLPSPKFSIFERSETPKFDCKIGESVPIGWEILGFGESISGSYASQVRFAPMLAPNYSNSKSEIITAMVPLRSLMPDFESRFNFAEHQIEGCALPSLSQEEYKQLLIHLLQDNVSLQGSLLDYLGYPIYSDVFKSMLSTFTGYLISPESGEIEVNYPDGATVSINSDTNDLYHIYNYYELAALSGLSNPFEANKVFINQWAFDYRGNGYYSEDSDSPDYGMFLPLNFSFWFWKIYLNEDVTRVPTAASYNIINRIFNTRLHPTVSKEDSIGASLGDWIKACELNVTAKVVIESYQNYLFSFVLNDYLNDLPTYSSTENITLLPLMAHHRFFADWHINGNVPFSYEGLLDTVELDAELYITQFVHNLYDFIDGYLSNQIGTYRQKNQELEVVFRPNFRLFNDDFFTTLLPNSSAGQALEIPANATVVDLAKLSAFQRLIMRWAASSKYRDQVYNLFGVRVSDARLMQSYPIHRASQYVQVQEVIQSSSTDENSVLGGFAGRSISGDKSDRYNYYVEEPVIVIPYFSVVPGVEYMDCLHPNIFLNDILDFPLPEMDVLGFEPIKTCMLTGNLADQDTLGYSRQYFNWLAKPSSVHGHMRTTLDYWHLARRFDTVPALNDDLLRMASNEDFDRIFSIQDSEQLIAVVNWKCFVTRPVHRSIKFEI